MKVSKMMIDVSGDLLRTPDNLHEMQAHLDLVKFAWNLSLYSESERKVKLKSFIESQRQWAPSEEALKGLEWEYYGCIKRDFKSHEKHREAKGY